MKQKAKSINVLEIFILHVQGNYSSDEGGEGNRFLSGSFSLYTPHCMLLIMILSLKWLNQVTDGLQQCEIGKITEVEKSLSLKVTCLISMPYRKTGTFPSPS